MASLWEMAIKTSLGKLELREEFYDISDFLVANDIQILPITFQHVYRLTKLEYKHRDPFDRLIIAQAKAEGINVVTKDTHFPAYDIDILWE